MSINNKDRFAQFPSIEVDAESLDRYSDIETADGELIIYDEQSEDGWIQGTVWTAVESMR